MYIISAIKNHVSFLVQHHECYPLATSEKGHGGRPIHMHIISKAEAKSTPYSPGGNVLKKWKAFSLLTFITNETKVVSTNISDTFCTFHVSFLQQHPWYHPHTHSNCWPSSLWANHSHVFHLSFLVNGTLWVWRSNSWTVWFIKSKQTSTFSSPTFPYYIDYLYT